jgi:SAM-dependent methyltransferase
MFERFFKKDRDKKFFLFEYKKADGSFDYDLYKAIQTEGNKRKINRTWVRESDIVFLSDYIKKKIPAPAFGVCHGTRRGLEQQWFSDNLGCEVIGTEISDTATEYPNTVQWDFHEEKKEWDAKADFIYSNSFDHAYDPQKAIVNWLKALKPGGLCIIEHTAAHETEGVTKLDPFGASLEIMPFLILQWSGGTFSVREILSTPPLKDDDYQRNFLIIQKN